MSDEQNIQYAVSDERWAEPFFICFFLGVLLVIIGALLHVYFVGKVVKSRLENLSREKKGKKAKGSS